MLKVNIRSINWHRLSFMINIDFFHEWLCILSDCNISNLLSLEELPMNLNEHLSVLVDKRQINLELS